MRKEFIIGRDETCDICLWDQTNQVSRKHAVLRVDEDGKYWLTDTSTNGTFINGVRMVPNREALVSRNDVIIFANIEELDWTLIPKRTPKFLICVVAICSALLFVGTACYFIFAPVISSNKHSDGDLNIVDSSAVVAAQEVIEEEPREELKDSVVQSAPIPTPSEKVNPKEDKKAVPKQTLQKKSSTAPHKGASNESTSAGSQNEKTKEAENPQPKENIKKSNSTKENQSETNTNSNTSQQGVGIVI